MSDARVNGVRTGTKRAARGPRLQIQDARLGYGVLNADVGTFAPASFRCIKFDMRS